jgi:hypothetical protein
MKFNTASASVQPIIFTTNPYGKSLISVINYGHKVTENAKSLCTQRRSTPHNIQAFFTETNERLTWR